MIIHTHNGLLYACVRARVLQPFSPRKSGMRPGRTEKKKTNREPNGILFMAFFVHVDLLRCPSPVPSPTTATNNKNDFYEFFAFFDLRLVGERRPCPMHRIGKYAINMKSRWKVIRCGLFYSVCFWRCLTLLCAETIGSAAIPAMWTHITMRIANANAFLLFRV